MLFVTSVWDNRATSFHWFEAGSKNDKQKGPVKTDPFAGVARRGREGA